MQSTMKKFAFETVFDADGSVLRDASGGRSIFTLDEIEAARRDAYESGRTDATVQELAAVSAELARVAAALERLVRGYAGDLLRLRAGAAELALSAARAAAGEALDAYGADRVRAVVESVLSETLGAPRIVVKVGAGAGEQLGPTIKSLAAEYGAEAALIVREDATLGPGDVAIEWSEGHVALESAACLADIESRVRTRLAAAESVETRMPS